MSGISYFWQNIRLMSFAEKHIEQSYSALFMGLSSGSKRELIDRLTKSIEKDKIDSDSVFYRSFGAFASEKSAEELIADIKKSRKFRRKEIGL